MSEASATILAAIIGFLGGLIVAAYTFRQKADELFLAGLQYLKGGSQERNLGIAALELAWESRRHRRVIAPLLVGAAIYLLLESKQEDAAHDLHNLDRLMRLLAISESGGLLRIADKTALLEALKKKQINGPEKGPGLWLKQAQIDAWKKQFGAAG